MRICAKCGNQINDEVNVCPYCFDGYNPEIDKPINVQDVKKVATGIGKGVRLFRAIPLILIGGLMVFFCLFGLFFDVRDYIKYKGKTTATFVELANCEEYGSEGGYCDAIYSYEVDGSVYNIEDYFVTDDYESSIVVSYNLDEPKVSIIGDASTIETSCIIIMIMGIVFVLYGFLYISGKHVYLYNEDRYRYRERYRDV